MARDLYGECNDKGMPLDEFQTGWCSRCMSPECTRSLHGKTRFDVRTESWLERLFLNPPVMLPEDPRYADIAAKKFLTIDVGRTPEIRSDWVDPNALVQPAPEPVIAVQAPLPSPPQAPLQEGTQRSNVLLNAPDQSGTILPGSPAKVARDPWGAPAPAENVVPVGATVRFGKGSGV
jgi:hypothetical protein